jgi:hypothetical protein
LQSIYVRKHKPTLTTHCSLKCRPCCSRTCAAQERGADEDVQLTGQHAVLPEPQLVCEPVRWDRQRLADYSFQCAYERSVQQDESFITSRKLKIVARGGNDTQEGELPNQAGGLTAILLPWRISCKRRRGLARYASNYSWIRRRNPHARVHSK